MSTYFLLMSYPAGRVIRLITGFVLVAASIIGDGHGSLIWLLVLPATLGILTALLDINPLAIFFGLPLIGGDLRSRFLSAQPGETGLDRLTFVGDSLQHGSDLQRRP